MMLPEERCGTCRFWLALIPGDDTTYSEDRNYQVEEVGEGVCRRYPPNGQRRSMPPREIERELEFATDAAAWAQWPVTSGDVDWCGEWRGQSGDREIDDSFLRRLARFQAAQVGEPTTAQKEG